MNPTRAFNLTPAERGRVDEIDELGNTGSAAMDALVQRLDDPSWAVRRSVTGTLARMGDAAIAPLVDVLLHKRDHEGRLAAAVDTLVASSGEPDSALIRLVTSDAPPAVLCDAAQVLGRRRSTSAVDALAQLSAHVDDNVALAALEALGRIGGEVAIDLLIAAVASKNFFRSFPAIDVLGRSGSPRAVEPLVALLGERHLAVEAARALGRTGQQSATRALVGVLARQNDAQVRAAAIALTEIHDIQASRFGTAESTEHTIREGDVDAIDHRLVQTLTNADPTEQRAICRVLGWTAGDGAILGLIELLDADPAAAAAAAAGLAKLGATAEPRLVEALRSSGSDRRLLILPLLGARAKIVNDVRACLADPNPNVRALACETLGRIGDTSVVAELFPLLADLDARVSQGAVGAIQSLGSAETQRLALEATRSTDARVRRAALRIVSYFGYGAALPILVDAMGDSDERIRDVAAMGLASIEDPRAVSTLLAAASHESPRTRAAAVRALGQTPISNDTRRALHVALDDGDAWVRYYACQAVGRLRDSASESVIILRLADPAGQVRVAAVDALANQSTEVALEALHRAARSGEQDVERAALLGLGRMKRPESLDVLRHASNSPDAATRLVALSGLAEYATNDVLPALGAAVADADDSVRGAAVSLLSVRPGARAARVLIEQLGNQPMQGRVIAALAQPVEGRIEEISSALRGASAESAPLLVSALARMRRADADAAMVDAIGFDNVFTRRAVAAALAALRTDAALGVLETACREDSDREVRHICLAALAI